MTVDIRSSFEGLLASYPGPTSLQLAELVAARPEFFDLVVEELEKRFEREPGLQHGDPQKGKVRLAVQRLVEVLPEKRWLLWERFFHEGTDDNWLLACMKEYPELREVAWGAYLARCHAHRGYGRDMLDRVIQGVPELRDRAWEERRAFGHVDSTTRPGNLLSLFGYLSPDQQREAWQIMTAGHSCGYTTTFALFERAPALREAAFARLCEQGFVARHVMSRIFVHYPPFRGRAWTQILIHDPANRQFANEVEERLLALTIGEDIPDRLRLRALEELLRRDPFRRANPDVRDGESWWCLWIRRVIHATPSAAIRERVWEFGRARMSSGELQYLAGVCPGSAFGVRVWEELLSRRDATSDFFAGDMLRSKDFRFRAVKAILDRDASPDALRAVAVELQVPASIRMRALDRLLAHSNRQEACLRLLREQHDLNRTATPDVLLRVAQALLDGQEGLKDETLALIRQRVPELATCVDAREQRGTSGLLAALLRR